MGGAYLYSSDLWAAYVDQRQRGVGTKYLAWLFDFGRARADRTVGWLTVRDLDLKGAASVIRLLTASVSGNASLAPDSDKPVNALLRRAVRQMCLNWESTRGWERRHTWLGRTMQMIHRTWPKFRLVWNGGSLSLSGVPAKHMQARLSDAFLEDAARVQWQAKQANIIRTALTPHQQDFFLKSFLLHSCNAENRQLLGNNSRARISPLPEAIFPSIPQADTGAVRTLLRTLAGMEDFARTNAHYPRRTVHPDLSNDQLKHSCLYCLTQTSVIVEDSEWHAFCECPCSAAARERFRFSKNLEIKCSNPCSVDDLCSLLAAVAGSPRLSGELARFALNIRSFRRHLFRQLSSDGPSGRTLVAARSAALLV